MKMLPKYISTPNYSAATFIFSLDHHTHHNTHKLYFAELSVTTANLFKKILLFCIHEKK